MKRTISVLVEDKPGALARIATMFARRGFNIDSLAVGPTERTGVSCITLRVDCRAPLAGADREADPQARQRAPRDGARARRGGRARAAPAQGGRDPERRAELIATATAFKGRVVDLGADTVTFELTGTPEELDAFQELARPHGIQELVRTGRVGMARASAKKPRRLSAIN